MRYLKSFNEHYNQGYWGNIGGGVVLFCTSTRRFLIGFRSDNVMEPNLCWGTFGGKLDVDEGVDETIEEAVLREVEEETGYKGNTNLIKGYIFRDSKKNFEYHNYIGIINTEFKPILNWENDDARWVTLDELYNIRPKHPGLDKFIKESRHLFEKYGI